MTTKHEAREAKKARRIACHGNEHRCDPTRCWTPDKQGRLYRQQWYDNGTVAFPSRDCGYRIVYKDASK